MTLTHTQKGGGEDRERDVCAYVCVCGEKE